MKISLWKGFQDIWNQVWNRQLISRKTVAVLKLFSSRTCENRTRNNQRTFVLVQTLFSGIYFRVSSPLCLTKSTVCVIFSFTSLSKARKTIFGLRKKSCDSRHLDSNFPALSFHRKSLCAWKSELPQNPLWISGLFLNYLRNPAKDLCYLRNSRMKCNNLRFFCFFSTKSMNHGNVNDTQILK